MKSIVLLFKKKKSKNRGVSQVVGSLFMLAIVSVIGTSLLFTGIDNINEFRDFLGKSTLDQGNTFREELIFSHIRFDPASSSSELNIYIRNIDSFPTTIEAITVVKVDTQELLVNDNILFQELLGKDIVGITYSDSSTPPLTLPSNCDDWEDDDCESSQYKISATTTRGNFIEVVAQPFGT